jgi:hypothetical protein
MTPPLHMFICTGGEMMRQLLTSAPVLEAQLLWRLLGGSFWQLPGLGIHGRCAVNSQV